MHYLIVLLATISQEKSEASVSSFSVSNIPCNMGNSPWIGHHLAAPQVCISPCLPCAAPPRMCHQENRTPVCDRTGFEPRFLLEGFEQDTESLWRFSFLESKGRGCNTFLITEESLERLHVGESCAVQWCWDVRMAHCGGQQVPKAGELRVPRELVSASCQHLKAASPSVCFLTQHQRV